MRAIFTKSKFVEVIDESFAWKSMAVLVQWECRLPVVQLSLRTGLAVGLLARCHSGFCGGGTCDSNPGLPSFLGALNNPARALSREQGNCQNIAASRNQTGRSTATDGASQPGNHMRLSGACETEKS